MNIEYSAYNCNPTGDKISRDRTKFVMIINKVTGLNQWIYSEWFYYDIPIKILFDWIEFIEGGLKHIKYDLIIELNNGQKLKLQRKNNIFLKDLCSNHMVEISCVNKS